VKDIIISTQIKIFLVELDPVVLIISLHHRVYYCCGRMKWQ